MAIIAGQAWAAPAASTEYSVESRTEESKDEERLSGTHDTGEKTDEEHKQTNNNIVGSCYKFGTPSNLYKCAKSVR
jgi:hypothetical protein